MNMHKFYSSETYKYLEGYMPVKFLNRNGYDHEPGDAVQKGLVEGETYYIQEEHIGKWHTSYKLYGVDGSFNSDMFEVLK